MPTPPTPTPPGPTPAPDAAPDDACVSAVRKLAAGALTDWKGLPAGCTTAQLGQVLGGGGDPAGNGKLSTRPTRFRNYTVAGQAQPLQIWFDDQDHALLVTWIAPTVAGTVSALLAALGSPDAKLDPGVGYHADAHQWVYASRGLTLYVREQAQTLARISAYAPTTVADYEARLGGRDQREYLPRTRPR